MTEMIRVAYDELVRRLRDPLERSGMTSDRAGRCAELFANSSRDGVPSHGVNRFGGFVRHLREGIVAANAAPVKVSGEGALERWDGQRGPGPLNAAFAMGRAVELAHAFGIGCIALRNTNHWMRAGNYGWQAAESGCVGICWTNATPTMAAWGGHGRTVGNNPLVMAVPRAGRAHVVLDMAMSQFSFGKLGVFERAGEQAPLVAGFDAQGNMTHDPGAVLHGGRAMPIGYWKGSGLAMLLDMTAAVMTGGMASWQVAKGRADQGVSQMFLAMDPGKVGMETEAMDDVVEGILTGVGHGEGVLYPGERALATRKASMESGVLVDRALWEEILKL